MSAVPSEAAVSGEIPGVAQPPFTFAPDDAPRWFGALAIVLIALIQPMGYLGDEGEALLTAVGGLAALAFVLRRRAPPVGVVILSALTIWTVVTYAWSPLRAQQGHPHGFDQIQALTAPKLLAQLVLDSAFVAGAIRLAPDQRDRALKWLVWTLLATMAVQVVDALAGGGLTSALSALAHTPLTPDIAKRNGARGCYSIVLFFWPFALLVWNRMPAAVPTVVAIAVAVSAVVMGVDAPAAAMVLSGLVFLAARANWRATTIVCLVASVIYFLTAPFVFMAMGGGTGLHHIGKMSWHVRLDVWRFASHLIAQKPWLGYGLDASRAYQPDIPMHPHDAAIQLWLETGLPGAALGALFFAWLFYKVLRLGASDPAWAGTACATTSIYLLIGAISFGVWQEWWISLGACVLAVSAMTLRARRDGRPTGAAEPAPGAGHLRAL